MNLTWREAAEPDHALLAEWNHQLIRDEGHRNPMNVTELSARMQRWLEGEYRAVVFARDEPVAYALFKTDSASVHLRQFFVRRERRGEGIGHAAMALLREKIWSPGLQLTVDVLCANPRAIRFYRSVGFQDYSLAMEIVPPIKGFPLPSRGNAAGPVTDL